MCLLCRVSTIKRVSIERGVYFITDLTIGNITANIVITRFATFYDSSCRLIDGVSTHRRVIHVEQNIHSWDVSTRSMLYKYSCTLHKAVQVASD